MFALSARYHLFCYDFEFILPVLSSTVLSLMFNLIFLRLGKGFWSFSPISSHMPFLFATGRSGFFPSPRFVAELGWAEVFCLQFHLPPTPLCYRRGGLSKGTVCPPSSPACFPLPSFRPVLSSGAYRSPGAKGIGCSEPSRSVLLTLPTPCAVEPLTQCARGSDIFSSGVVADVWFTSSPPCLSLRRRASHAVR